jgi:hypothetical protein
VGRFNED